MAKKTPRKGPPAATINVRVGSLKFKSDQIVDMCVMVWKQFFSLLARYYDSNSRCQGAIWVFHLPSASFRVRPQMVPGNAKVPERFTVSVRVDGLGEEVNKAVFDDTPVGRKRYRQLEIAFVDWLSSGVVASWKTHDVRKLARGSNCLDGAFTVAYARNDDVNSGRQLKSLVNEHLSTSSDDASQR